MSNKNLKVSAKRIAFIIIVSLLTIAVIAYFTFNEKTLSVMAKINPFYLFCIILIWFFMRSADSISLVLYSSGSKIKVGFIQSFNAAALRIFYNLITPFSFGGHPAVVYMLNKQGIPLGESSSIVLIKLLVYNVCNLTGSGIALIFFRKKLVTIPALGYISLVTGILSLVTGLVVVIGYIYPPFIIGVTTPVGKILYKLKIIKDYNKFRKRIIKEFSVARRTIKNFFSKHLSAFIGGSFFTALLYLGRVILLWLIFRALNLPIPFVEGCVFSILIMFAISFLPTPGALGLGEGLFALLSTTMTIPVNTLGLVLILWRFFYQQIGATIGAFVSSREFSKFLIK